MFDLWKLRSGLYFAPDDPASATPGTEPGKPAGKKTDEPPGSDETPADLKSGDDVKDKKPAEFKWTPEQQAEIDRIMGETRKQERKKAKADADTELAKAKKDAEDKELQEKQEFKTLAEKRQKEIETLQQEKAALEDAKALGEKYKSVLEADLKARTEKLPKHIQTLLSKLDVLEQMEYLTKNGKDLGVKLDSVDETPKDDTESEKAHEQKQSKEMHQFVKGIT